MFFSRLTNFEFPSHFLETGYGSSAVVIENRKVALRRVRTLGTLPPLTHLLSKSRGRIPAISSATKKDKLCVFGSRIAGGQRLLVVRRSVGAMRVSGNHLQSQWAILE